ncbi:DNA-binding GntR family transcriptional regulator [Palleronia aestuarii]|uniref:DNA-binding GntR family transcriptional regulator n=1 Tax=Palleronia aestuarii TaxID=568105 RepID=A0A2W7MSC3_9RHOB|nr:GntR family transcriptional regulator [Palleronia aestuarii]PZX10848.1 DNA-binding GntR family transcriptional regulator [Palleronia aestuarii]
MARSDTRYREAFNAILDFCATLAPGSLIPSEQTLSERTNVSRTVVRRCLARLQEHGVISWQGREKVLLRMPVRNDRLEIGALKVSPEDLEGRFLDWILRFDIPAGTPLSIADLSRKFEVPQHELKEFLAGLSRFGLVARRPKGGWRLSGFTADFAVELSDFRALLELNAVRQAANAPPDDPFWSALSDLRSAHVSLSKRIDTDYHSFSGLDEQFHQRINGIVRNRFFKEFQKVISLIFHYHYLWNKADERERNAAAIEEHLAIIDALEARDADGAVVAARRHLDTSKMTLLSSLRYHELA